MANFGDAALREQLLDRLSRLGTAISHFGQTEHLVRLLQDVDSALERMDAGTYGLCETCREPIEKDRLAADPLVRHCLDHLTSEQRNALEQDLDLAWRIQAALLPRNNLSFGGWEIYYHYEAAGAVSGDYCDLVNGSNGFFFSLGDVSGKGVASSLLMSHLHAIFRTLLAADLPLPHLVERANRVFCESTLPTSYATLVCGRAQPSGEVEICNAGHCPPLLLRADEGAKIEATGLPLGLFGTGQYFTRRLRLEPGQSLFLYSDGLTEAGDRSSTEYGLERLARFAGRCSALSAEALAKACLDDLAAFLSGAPKTDDVTIMVVRRV